MRTDRTVINRLANCIVYTWHGIVHTCDCIVHKWGCILYFHANVLYMHGIQCSPFTTNFTLTNFAHYERKSKQTNKQKATNIKQKPVPSQAFSFSLLKFRGYNVSGYSDSSTISHQTFQTGRASSSDITFRNVRAEITARPVLQSGQRPYSHACVAIRSLLWAWERMCCSRAERVTVSTN